MKYKFLLAALVLNGFLATYAQQDAQFSQYMYNTMSINPAYAGSRGHFSSLFLNRSQWIGLNGAPETQTLALHTPMGQESRVGLGLSVINDAIGPSQETTFAVNFSYALPMGDTGKLAFGINGGGQFLNIDLNDFNAFNPNDPQLQSGVDNDFAPQVGIGSFYYTDRFYLGASIPNLLETTHFDQSDSSDSFLAKERLHLHVITGYVFDLNRTIKFKPAALLKTVSGSPLQLDMSANFLFNQKFMLGAAYRLDAAVSFLGGFHITRQLMLGLAYDREVTELSRSEFNDGSFEIFLRFEIFRKANNIFSPRFF